MLYVSKFRSLVLFDPISWNTCHILCLEVRIEVVGFDPIRIGKEDAFFLWLYAETFRFYASCWTDNGIGEEYQKCNIVFNQTIMAHTSSCNSHTSI